VVAKNTKEAQHAKVGKLATEKGIAAGYVSEKEEEDKKIEEHLLATVKEQHEALEVAKKDAADMLQDAAPITIRPSLATFIVEMELVLRLHDSQKGKDGWLSTHPLVLNAKLMEEVGELSFAVLNSKSQGNIKREAADVANLAFMIAHKSGNL